MIILPTCEIVISPKDGAKGHYSQELLHKKDKVYILSVRSIILMVMKQLKMMLQDWNMLK